MMRDHYHMRVTIRPATADEQQWWERGMRDVEYFQRRERELIEQYPESWIAILDQEVVGVAPTFEELLAGLRARGMPTERVLIQDFTTSDDILLLPG